MANNNHIMLGVNNSNDGNNDNNKYIDNQKNVVMHTITKVARPQMTKRCFGVANPPHKLETQIPLGKRCFLDHI